MLSPEEIHHNNDEAFPKDISINHLHIAQEKDFQLNFLNVTKTVIKHELLEIGIIFISIWGTYGKMIIH